MLAGFPSPVGTEKQDQCCQAGQQVPRTLIHCSLSLFQEELAQQLDALQTRTKQTLLSAFPGVTMSSQQVGQASSAPPRASPTWEGEMAKHPPPSLFSFFQTQDYDTWLQEFKEKTVGVLKQQMITTEPSVSEGWKVEGRGSAGGSHVSSPHLSLLPFPLFLGFSS